MGRQTALEAKSIAGNTANANINVRIDPYSLPQTFKYNTGLGGEAAEAAVFLDRGTATVNRRLPSGLPTAVRLSMEMFEGVAVRMVPGNGEATIVLELLHCDPELSLPLMVTTSMDDVVADWRAWGRILSLPLLTVAADGSYQAVEPRLGCVTVKPVLPRRRRSVLAQRRPRFLVRRRTGQTDMMIAHAGEHEITSWE